MRVAITGATGFLGRYLVQQLAADGHELRCWFRDESKRIGLPEDIDWQKGALADPQATAQLVQGVDAVVHAAVQWHRTAGARSGGNLLDFAQTNVMGSLMLMDAAHRAGVGRFIFISSCAVHDRVLYDRALDETHPLWPESDYGAYKAAVEAFVSSMGLGKGWPVCALRPTGIYGLAEPPSASKWFDLVGRVMRGESIESTKGGKEVHVIDVTKAVALLLAADAEQIRGQAFNCYDLYISDQRVAQLARDMVDSKSTIADLNRGPKNQIVTTKLRALGMQFGGEALLEQTVQQMVRATQEKA